MPENAAGSTTKARKGGSPFVMISVFLVVLLIMFDNNLRLATGAAVGAVFNPVADLWNHNVLWTLVFASVVMILATTAIRHFLVDWVGMARTQEVMRTFQREFADARKSNNTYKMKKLTDAQPQIMQLQAEMSTGQLKPMAFTMLLVIPIFAWLSTITLAPVAYSIATDGDAAPSLLVGVGPDLQAAHLVESGEGTLELLHGVDLYALEVPGADASGSVTLHHPNTGRETTLDLSGDGTIEWARYEVGTLAAGAYNVKPEGDPKVTYVVGDDEHTTLSHLLLLVPSGGGAVDALFVDGDGADFTLDAPAEVHAVIPLAEGLSPTGGIVDTVRPAGGGDVVAQWTLTVEEHVLATSPGATGVAHAELTPHSAKLPWNPSSDLNDAWWVLPHWILLYSLFSIPIGQVTQRALKLWEYGKVDLDADGKAPGLNVE